MKMMIALLAVSFFATANAQQKQRNWDARLAVGSGTYPYLQDGGRFLSWNIFAPEFTAGSYSAAVLYQTSNQKIKIGLSATHIRVEQYHVAGISLFGGSDRTYLLSVQKVNAIMPVFNYSYIVRKNSRLYSELCAGAAFTTHTFYEKKTSEHSVNAAFQCTLLGYRLGKRIGVFTELGYGYKGIIQIGVSGAF